MNSKRFKSYYKRCAVPQCKNTSVATPNKVFVHVPYKKKIRDIWLKLAWRNPNDIGTNTPIYFCEDHFDLPNDMINYMEYHVMGSVSKVRMKPECLPKKFKCQPDRATRTSDITKRPYVVKKQRIMTVQDSKKFFKDKRTDTEQTSFEEIASSSSFVNSTQPVIYYNNFKPGHSYHWIKSQPDPIVPSTSAKINKKKKKSVANYFDEQTDSESFLECTVDNEDMPNLSIMDNSLTQYNLQFCRVCFASGCKLNIMTERLNKAYKMLTGLLIENEDNLPPYLCSECAQRLLNCIRFRARSLRAHLILVQVSKKHNNVTLENVTSLVTEKIGSNLSVTHNPPDHYDLEINHDDDEENMQYMIDNIKEEPDTFNDEYNDSEHGNIAECDIKDEMDSDGCIQYEYIDDDIKNDIDIDEPNYDNPISSDDEENSAVEYLQRCKKIRNIKKIEIKQGGYLVPVRNVEVDVRNSLMNEYVDPTTSKRSNYNKKMMKHVCPYCEQLVTHFTRHLLRRHSDEPEVLVYAAEQKSDDKENNRKLRKIADIVRGSDNLVYNCVENEEENIHNSSSYEKVNNRRKYILLTHCASEELYRTILPLLRNDEISNIVKSDFLILLYGTKLLENNKKAQNREIICSKMRDLATIVAIVNRDNPQMTMFEQLLDSSKYELLNNAVKKMTACNNKIGDVKTTLARLQYSIFCCVDILRTQMLLDNSLTIPEKDNIKKRLDDFKKIMFETNWESEIALKVKKTCKIETVETKSTDAEKGKHINIDVSVENNEKNSIPRRITRNIKRSYRISTDTDKGVFKERKRKHDNGPKEIRRKKLVHIFWTEEEMNIVQDRFKFEIAHRVNPGKVKCTAVLQEEPTLHRRTWQQLNTCVNNIYVKGLGKRRKSRYTKT